MVQSLEPSLARQEDLGWEYFEAIDGAIEQLIAEEVAANPARFRHDGVDLRWAAARDLYCGLAAGSALYPAYCQARTTGSVQGIRFGSSAEERLASVLLRRFDLSRLPKANRRELASGRLRRLAGKLSAAWRFKQLSLLRELDRTAPGLRSTRVYILVHEWKFVRYVEALVNELGMPNVVFLSSHPRLSAELAEREVRHVALDRWAMVNYGLSADAGLWDPPSPGYHYLVAQYDAVRRLFDIHQPRVGVVLEGNAAADEVFNQLCRQRGVPCVCIQHGWSPLVHTGFRHLSFTEMLVWGQGFAAILQPYNPEQRFRPTGNHVLDDLASFKSVSRKEVQAGRRPLVVFFLQAIDPLITRDCRESFLLLITEAAGRWPEALMAVREHPSYPMSEREAQFLSARSNIMFVPAASHDLGQLLKEATTTVATHSSTIVESVASLVPPVIFNPTSMPHYVPDVAAVGAGVEVRDRAQALEAIGRLIKDHAYRDSFLPAMRAFRECYFQGVDGNGLRPLVSAIRKHAEDSVMEAVAS